MQKNNSNILLASIISAAILIAWTWLYEKPKLEAQKNFQQSQEIVQQDSINLDNISENQSLSLKNDSNIPVIGQNISINQVLESTQNQRIAINTPKLTGSINLKGLKFDDLILNNYNKTIDPESGNVTLLAPAETADQYQINFGYRGIDQEISLPDENSIWQASSDNLTPENPIIFSWNNDQKVNFEVTISVDENYMFFVSQKITNNSTEKLELLSIASIFRTISQSHSSIYILHEGPIGVFDGILTEEGYDDLEDKKFSQIFNAKDGWFGITDKYWLVSIIPEKNTDFSTQFFHYNNNNSNSYQVKYQSAPLSIESGSQITLENKIFAGAKKVSMLDDYSKEYDITRFDLAVDFGWYYFLTKPFFFILQFFNNLFGNYGLAILSITVLIKLVMFPLANKSFTSMAKIKQLSPKLMEIREEFKDKKMQMNKEIMQLYKREKVNPVSGCLPMLIQIPVFFSLYKVLYLTIDMRHAPFFGWIKDLSAPDPTSIINLFGILPFEGPAFISIGLWPIFMGLTMVVQQKLNPAPADPVQAKIMKLLPFILIFVFAPFAAGLLIYWTWSNVLSILQQWVIMRKLAKQEVK
ncbi:MAG: YidC/Oxa1 family membrane protein insertase [Lentimonas sp.]|jgi:YidC/Oxa1 family membrane protein insertase